MHVVHFKSCYNTQDKALREKDGLLVIAYFFKISPEPNPDIQCIINALTQIVVPHTSCQLPPQPISSFLHMFDRDYFLYWGSVMTSSCAHRILWFVSREPIPISLEQVCLATQTRVQG
uniref:Alpha-carbonic anhydrase domain-containing protein n=1 Tax=Timema bartmani TaxID=61472 RepID=A0A7R9FFU0_9NEOP|nr:unnamed protein product [Timema bartmani]